MPKIFYRREPFGAVILDSSTDKLSMVSPQLADCVEYKSAGMTDIEATNKLIKTYPKIKKTADLLRQSNDLLSGVFPEFEKDTAHPMEFPALSFPLDLFWEITRKCNENCLHCYNNSGPYESGPSDDQLYSVISELKQTKLRRLSISGGEPLTHKSFEKFVYDVRPLAHELSLSTNGTLVTESRAEHISEYFDDVNISLDTPIEEEFDRFRGLRGAFIKTVDGIKRIRAKGINVVIQTVLTYESSQHLDELAVLLSSLGVTHWNIRLAFASGRGVSNADIFPSPIDLEEVDDNVKTIKAKYADFIPHIYGGVNYMQTYKESYKHTKNAKRLVTCSGGTILAALAADGSLAPCPLFSETNYCSEPVWKIGFQNAWIAANCMKEMRTTTSDQIKGCGTCSNLNGECGGGCRAKSYLRKGTVLSNDYHCGYSIPNKRSY